MRSSAMVLPPHAAPSGSAHSCTLMFQSLGVVSHDGLARAVAVASPIPPASVAGGARKTSLSVSYHRLCQ